MAHKGLIAGTSIGAGILIFFTLYLTEGLLAGIIGGVIALIASLIFMLKAFRRSDAALERLTERLRGERIEYSGTASLMIGNKEMVGALAITDRRAIFEAIVEDGQSAVMEFTFDCIEAAQDSGGFLLLTGNDGIVYRFKVFQCDAILDAIRASR